MYELSQPPRIDSGLPTTQRVEDNSFPLTEAREPPCLLMVICLVIKAFQLVSKGKCIEACSCVGAAAVNAQAIGLHRRNASALGSTPFDADENLARKMAWSSCLFLDKLLLGMGFSSAIDMRLCDAVAATVDDLKAAQSFDASLNSDQSTSDCTIRLSACLHRWAIVMDQIAVTFYAPKKPTQAAADQCEEQLLSLRKSMKQLLADQMDIGRAMYPTDDSHHSRPLFAVRLLVHQACIQLHWRFDSPARQAASTQSAIAAAEMLEKSASYVEVPAWAIHAISTAATELVASFARASSEVERSNLLKFITIIEDILRSNSATLPLAAHRLSLLKGVRIPRMAAYCDAAGRLDDLLSSHQQYSPLHVPAQDTDMSHKRTPTHPFAPAEAERPRLVPCSTGPDSFVDTRMSLGCPNGSLYSSAPDLGVTDWAGSGYNAYAGADSQDHATVGSQRAEEHELLSNAAEPLHSSQQHLLPPSSSSFSRGSHENAVRPLASWHLSERSHEETSPQDCKEQHAAAHLRSGVDLHGGIKSEGGEIGNATDASSSYTLADAMAGSGHPRTEVRIRCNTRDARHSAQAEISNVTERSHWQARSRDTCSSSNAYEPFPSLTSERKSPPGHAMLSSLFSTVSATKPATLPWNGNVPPQRLFSISDDNVSSTVSDTTIGLGLNLKLGNALPADAFSSCLAAAGAVTFGITSTRETPTSLLPGSRSQGESSSTLRRALEFRRPKEEPDLATPTFPVLWKTVQAVPAPEPSTELAKSLERSHVRPHQQQEE